MEEKKHKVELTDETAVKHWEEILHEAESAYLDSLARGGSADDVEEQSIYHLRYILDLIRRLQSEKERLTEENAGYEGLKLFNLAMANGELDMTISGEYAKAFFNAIVEIFDQNGAKNYFTTTIDIEGRKGRYAFTIEKVGGQTVAEILAEQKEEIERYQCVNKLLEGDIEALNKALEKRVEDVYADFMQDYKIMCDELNGLYEENSHLDGCAKQSLADYQKCEIENAELRKQVDELKEKSKKVNGLVKEVIAFIEEKDKKAGKYSIYSKLLQEVKERFGVEVE